MRRLVALVLLAVAGAAPPAAAGDAQARERFLRDRDASALAASLGASADPADRADAALARLAADPAARLGADDGGPVAGVVDRLRAGDLAGARASIAGPGFPKDAVPGAWLDALAASRAGQDEGAVRAVLGAGPPVPARDGFALALLGASLARDDRELLVAVLHRAMVRASAEGRLEGVAALAEGAVMLDPGAGERTLALAARVLRRGGRDADAAAVLAGPGAARVGADRPALRLERAILAWRRGDAAGARVAVAGAPAGVPWGWAFAALSRAAAAPRVLPAAGWGLAEAGDDLDAGALARVLGLLGRPTARAQVAAQAAAKRQRPSDPAFARALLEAAGFRAVASAGDPQAARDAAARGFPVVFWRPRRHGDAFADVPVVLRGHDPSTDLFVADEPSGEALDVVPGEWLAKGRLLVVVPQARAAEVAALSASPAGRLGSRIEEVLPLLAGATPQAAAEALAAAASEFPGQPVLDLYCAFASYAPAAGSRDPSARTAAGAWARRSGAQAPALAFERFMRAVEAPASGDGVDAVAADLAAAAAAEGPAAWIETARFLLFESARRHAEAMEALAVARALDPLDVRTLFYRGSTRRILGDGPGARADLVRTLERRPDYVAAAEDLANLHLDAGEAERALSVVSALAAADPEAGGSPRVRQLRQRAEVRLVRRASKAADLLPLVESPEPDTRREVAWTASSFEDPEAEALLVRLLDDPDEGVRRRVSQAFQRAWLTDRLAEDAGLRAALARRLADDPTPVVREAAALALGRVESAEAEALLLARLSGPGCEPLPAVRAAVVDALDGHEGRPVLAALVAALEDADPVVRGAALRSLQRAAGTTHGFVPGDAPERRAAALEAWRRWLASR